MKIVAKRKYKYPMALEREYAKQIRGITADMFDMIRKQLPKIITLIKKHRIKLDDDSDDVDEYMETLTALLLLSDHAEPYTRRMWRKVQSYTDKEIRQIFQALFGSSVSMRGLKTEYMRNQIIKEMTEESNKYNVELTEEEKVAIGEGILLSSILSAPEPKRKAIEKILRDRPAGVDIISSSQAEIALQSQKRLKQLEDLWVKENLNLIKNVEVETLEKLRWQISDLIANGADDETILQTMQEWLVFAYNFYVYVCSLSHFNWFPNDRSFSGAFAFGNFCIKYLR